MRSADQYVFGLDIGTRSVVGTVGYKTGTNDFTVVAQKVKMHETRAMLDGQIHDIGKVAETISSVKRDLERQLGGAKLTDVCIAAAGRVLKTVTVHADIEYSEENTVSDTEIRELELKGVEKAYTEIKTSLKDDKTNYYCVAYTVVHYYLNGFQISNLKDHRAQKVGADVLATFLPDEVIEGLYTTVEKAGLKVNTLTLEPIAAMLVAIPEKFRLLNIALVDIGAGTSDICLTKDGSVIAYGMIPMAGDSLTEIIAENHLVEFNTAEEMKLSLAKKKKSISYVDIMGLKQKTEASALYDEIAGKIDELAEKISSKIIEMNGGKTVSACFVVGGGGKIKGFTGVLAEKLGIKEERVALRGAEVLSFVKSIGTDFVPAPEYVTPIGICLNYYEKKNNFIYVQFNGEPIKLYDNNKLTVTDAAIAAGYPNSELFPKRGAAIEYTLNLKARLVRGEPGDSAVITVNNKPSSVNTLVEPNDDIKIIPSTAGKDAYIEVGNIPEFKETIGFYVDGKYVKCPKFISANGELVSKFYAIKNGDALVNLDYYTVSQILDMLDIKPQNDIYVNNEKADKDTKVYENFKVETEKKEEAKENKTKDSSDTEKITEKSSDSHKNAGENNENNTQDIKTQDIKSQNINDAVSQIVVIFNNVPLTLSGKKEYRIVDALDKSGFDINKPKGNNLEIMLNGMSAQFIDLIKDKDELLIHWV